MRASVRREAVIEASADAAWRLVGRPELLHLWFPGVVTSTVEGDVRTITLATGLTLDETILTNDPLQRRFQYRIEPGTFFTEHLATVDVIALGADRCLVTYGSDAAPATMAVVLGGATGAALEELRRRLESDDDDADAAIDDADAAIEEVA
jgi:Polyketide cyclase / dehydrase and lipid transport